MIGSCDSCERAPGKYRAVKDPADLPTLHSLDEVVDLVGGRGDLFVRWSKGPNADAEGTSRDDLTGVPLPGLCANPLAVEEWWGDRPMRTWVARRLFDYRHLRDRKGGGIRPWILTGKELGRGPDNEPIVAYGEAVALIDDAEAEAEAEVAAKKEDWGPLDRG